VRGRRFVEKSERLLRGGKGYVLPRTRPLTTPNERVRESTYYLPEQALKEACGREHEGVKGRLGEREAEDVNGGGGPVERGAAEDLLKGGGKESSFGMPAPDGEPI